MNHMGSMAGFQTLFFMATKQQKHKGVYMLK